MNFLLLFLLIRLFILSEKKGLNMTRTTVMLPEKLKVQAANQAREKGMTLGEFIRESMRMNLKMKTSSKNTDPFFSDAEVFEGDAPQDIAEQHDYYLYGEKL